MSIYAIGDVQGCYDELMSLLDCINYDNNSDILWFAGDIVNRGPDSLSVLRFIHSLKNKAVVVLGNHDLHLLALYFNCSSPSKKDTLCDVLQASDCEELMQWLRQQPLAHYDETRDVFMSHAGLPPNWSIQQALRYSKEAQKTLNHGHDFFKCMYGNTPNKWEDLLTGTDRIRSIVNTFTRMRFCTDHVVLDFDYKDVLMCPIEGYQPWFLWNNKKLSDQTKIVFGHWAALNGHTGIDNVFALDTGCAWGGKLSALKLDDMSWWQVESHVKNTF
jgi:bis(5'-nucleosyl)-tetraphosphatase (symmetrical)